MMYREMLLEEACLTVLVEYAVEVGQNVLVE